MSDREQARRRRFRVFVAEYYAARQADLLALGRDGALSRRGGRVRRAVRPADVLPPLAGGLPRRYALMGELHYLRGPAHGPVKPAERDPLPDPVEGVVKR